MVDLSGLLIVMLGLLGIIVGGFIGWLAQLTTGIWWVVPAFAFIGGFVGAFAGHWVERHS